MALALRFPMFFEHRHFRTNDGSRRIFDQLDPIWAPKRVPRGAQDEPKTDPRRVQNRVQNRVEKMIEKWTAQGSTTAIDNGHTGPQVPTGGVGESSKQPKDQYPRSSTPIGLKAWRI